jgi:hypothetical protein
MIVLNTPLAICRPHLSAFLCVVKANRPMKMLIKFVIISKEIVEFSGKTILLKTLGLILINAKLGALWDGVQASDQMSPAFERGEKAESAQIAFQNAKENPIELILPETASFGERFANLTKGIKTRWQENCGIIVVNSHKQKYSAEAAKAEDLFVIDFPSDALFIYVQQMRQASLLLSREHELSP